VKHYHGAQRRRSLGIYNAFGDVGKLSFTALFGLLIGIGLAWDHVVMLLALTALVSAAIVFRMLPPTAAHSPDQSPSEPASTKGWGIRKPFYFGIVATVSLLDGIVQAVFLTFIAFVMLNKGASAATASLAVVLTLAGGMVGKFAGGFLAAQLGDRMAFQLLQAMTIAGLLAVIGMPATILIMLLPLIGVAVQGSSTIYYGCVADCAEPDKQSRAYSLVYTLANGSSVVGPLVLGAIADHFGLDSVMWSLIALTALTMVLGIGFGSRHDDTA